MNRFRSFIGSAGLIGLLFGCATPVPPPVVNLATHQCVTTPNLAGAQPLVFTPDKVQDVTVVYDDTAACLEDQPGAKSLYHVFVLPPATQPYLITIGTDIWGGTLFAPRVQFLGADGSVKRIVARPDFVFRGTMLSAILRNHPDEAYLVVASDPQVVGRSNSRIDDSTYSQGVSTGRAFFMMYRGTETMTTQIFSHGGRVTISLEALPAK